jgi:hypothetical protein
MAGVVARTRMGPETFNAGESILGGSLVKAGSGGTAGMVIKTTGVNDQWLGVTAYDAEPATTTGVDTTYSGSGNYPRIGLDVPRPEVAVIWHGTVKIFVSETVNFGDIVYPSATAGRVQKTTTTGRAVGQVVSTGGAASGTQALVRLF